MFIWNNLDCNARLLQDSSQLIAYRFKRNSIHSAQKFFSIVRAASEKFPPGVVPPLATSALPVHEKSAANHRLRLAKFALFGALVSEFFEQVIQSTGSDRQPFSG